MSKSLLYGCDNTPVDGRDIERIIEPQLDWWKEVNGRDLKAESVFKRHLEEGSLEVKVYDQNKDGEYRITQAEWRDQKVTFGGLLSPFNSEVISQPTGDPLAAYNGLTPYMRCKDFDRWLGRRKKMDNRHGRAFDCSTKKATSTSGWIHLGTNPLSKQEWPVGAWRGLICMSANDP
jgi:hypothetical protein